MPVTPFFCLGDSFCDLCLDKPLCNRPSTQRALEPNSRVLAFVWGKNDWRNSRDGDFVLAPALEDCNYATAPKITRAQRRRRGGICRHLAGPDDLPSGHVGTWPVGAGVCDP